MEAQMLTLYGDLDSGNVYKVRLLLAQLSIPYRRVDTSQNRGETRTPEFRAINPIGKIPTVLVDEGRALSESGAILFYLAQTSALWPDDAWDQAAVLRWMFFEQYSHEPFIAVNRHWRLHLSEAERERLADRIADNHARGEQALAVMEQQLVGSDWLAAGCYTIADIALYAYTHSAGDGGFDLTAYPAIGRWLDRVSERPRHLTQFEEGSVEPVVPWPGS
jgi:glutathione S-transferase